MNYYNSNPRCHCMRCRTSGAMGPAVLITLGVLFLLQESSSYSFGRTWPALLVVIGLISLFRRTAPTDGHVERGYEYLNMPPVPPSAQPSAETEKSVVVTPPPAPVAGTLPAATSEEEHHG